MEDGEEAVEEELSLPPLPVKYHTERIPATTTSARTPWMIRFDLRFVLAFDIAGMLLSKV
jgi:hypothetical protein